MENQPTKHSAWQECLSRAGGGKLKKINLIKFADKSGRRPTLSGVFHDGDGVRVATDGQVLAAIRGNADDAELKGMVTDKKGQVIEIVKYPDWRSVMPTSGADSVRIDIEKFKQAIAGQAEKLKRYNGLKKLCKKLRVGEYEKYEDELNELNQMENDLMLAGRLTALQAGETKYFVWTENAELLVAAIPCIAHAEMYCSKLREGFFSTILQGDGAVVLLASSFYTGDPKAEHTDVFDITAEEIGGIGSDDKKETERHPLSAEEYVKAIKSDSEFAGNVILYAGADGALYVDGEKDARIIEKTFADSDVFTTISVSTRLHIYKADIKTPALDDTMLALAKTGVKFNVVRENN